MRSKRFVIAMIVVIVIGVNWMFAGIGSDIPDKGKHYNLNIIGVQHDKKADMTGTQGHTIFVPLNKDGSVSRKVTIYGVRNYADPNKFEVLDRNATDDDEATIAFPFKDYGTLSFNVYATALGKPGRKAVVDPNAVFDANCIDCVLIAGESFEIKRDKGKKGAQKPNVVDITDVFRAEGCIDLDANDICNEGDLEFEDVWVFNVPNLLTYYWDYTNEGLKLAQIRFYPTESGSWTTKE